MDFVLFILELLYMLGPERKKVVNVQEMTWAFRFFTALHTIITQKD